MTSRSGRLRLSAVILACGLLAAGCSGSSDSGSTGTATAVATGDCAQVSAELERIGTELSGLPDKIPGDIPGAIATVQSVTASLGALTGSVTDPELRAKLTALTDSVATLQQELENASGDPIGSAGALLDAIASARSAYNDLKAYCGIE